MYQQYFRNSNRNGFAYKCKFGNSYSFNGIEWFYF